MIDIGRIAFTTYAQLTQIRDGSPVAKWEDLNQGEQNVWRDVAVSVLKYIQEANDQDPDVVG